MPIVIVIAALAPGLFWLWFYLRGSKFQPNPRRIIVGTFVLGMVSTIPAAVIELVLLRGEQDLDVTLGSAAAAMFFVVGPVEELSKFLAVRLWAAKSLHFDEPSDALEFAAAASLGFATLENIVYAFIYGPEIMIVRGPISTVAHVVFGSFWGWALARRQAGAGNRAIVPAGLAAAALAHGAFNFLLVTGYAWVALLLVVAGAFWVSRLFRWSRAISPFRLRRNVPVKSCPVCRHPFRSGSKFCERCGSSIQGAVGAITCARCKTVSRADAQFCSSCGDRFVEIG